MFLKALGLGLSLPLAAKLARLALAAPTAASKRFMIMFIPHGTAPEHYNPQLVNNDPTNFTLSDTNVSILGPLEPYKSYVNVYQGFKYQGGATHEGCVNVLSGTGGTDTTTPRTTVDQVIGKGLGVKPLILGACSHQPYGLDNHGMLFWNSTPIDPQKNPAAAADALFGNLGTNPNPTPTVDPNVELQSDLLNLTAGEIQTLQSSLSGLTTEQSKLQKHLEAIQAIQAANASGGSGGMGTPACTTKPMLPTVDQVRSASAGQVIDSSGGNDYFYQEQNFQLIFKAQLELIAQALYCNVAPVIGFMPMYPTCDFNFSFTQPGMTAPPGGWSHHLGLSHTSLQQAQGAMYNSPVSVFNLNPDTRAAFARAQRWFHQQLVDQVISFLATTADPSAPGTMVLDNTLIYLMSEVGDGSNHTTYGYMDYPQAPAYLPLVSIGKAGGGLKTGQVVNFGTTVDSNQHFVNDRPAGDLYATFCKAMGVTGASFPDGSTLVEGLT